MFEVAELEFLILSIAHRVIPIELPFLIKPLKICVIIQVVLRNETYVPRLSFLTKKQKMKNLKNDQTGTQARGWG